MNTERLKRPIGIFLAAVAFFIILAISYFHTLDIYELQTLDARFLLRPKPAVSDRIVIIEIGDDTIKKLGRFPFDRTYHALLVNALRDFGARFIVFDLFFSEPHKDDAELVAAITKAGTVYLPYIFEFTPERRGGVTEASGYVARNLETLTASCKGSGHINIVPDIDGKFRRIPVFVRYGNDTYPHLSFQVAADYLGIHKKDIIVVPGSHIRLDRLSIPLDGHSDMIVNYTGPWGGSYKHYSYVDILQSYVATVRGEKPLISPDELKDKICVVGLTATGTSDIHPNPFGALMPGVNVHLETLNAILTKNFVSRAPRWANIPVLILLITLTVAVTLRVKPIAALGALMASTGLFLIFAFLVFWLAGIWIDVVYPVICVVFFYMGTTLFRFVAEWKKRLLIERELEIARKIQQSFLPKTVPSIEGVEIAARMVTARQVGGDLYDFVDRGDGDVGIMIGDVSGKGVPASLFMAMVAGSFKFFATPGAQVERVLIDLNNKLCKESSSNLFVTVFYAAFDTAKKTVSYTNGGHLPLLCVSSDGAVTFLDVDEGTPLGLMEGDYVSRQFAYKSGDIFIFYTDGITEAMNEAKDMYEKDRLAAIVRTNRALSAGELADAITADVRRFEPKDMQHDDMTVIVVKMG